VQEEVGNLLTTLIEIEEGLLSGLAAKAELRVLLDELYDDLEYRRFKTIASKQRLRAAAYLAMEVVRDLRTEIRTAKKKAVVED
jgi:hypothetical protein